MAGPAAGSQWSEEDSDPIPETGAIVASRRRDVRRGDARSGIGTVFLVGVSRAREGNGRIYSPIHASVRPSSSSCLVMSGIAVASSVEASERHAVRRVRTCVEGFDDTVLIDCALFAVDRFPSRADALLASSDEYDRPSAGFESSVP